ncbi:MAG: cyclopropane fatty acyl phospholipid synthase [Acidiferrobacterales bacterium]
MNSLISRSQALLAYSGLTLNGNGVCDPQVRDERLYARVFAHGSLGFGEGYMDGWWDVKDLNGMLTRVVGARIDDRLLNLDTLFAHLRARWFNLQRGYRAWKIGTHHYDLGNDLFEAMLGKRLVYSCGYWAQSDTLDDAQEAKLDLVCRKLQLKPGMHVLDIGCGWGEALKFAAERYGVSGVGVTVSKEQAVWAKNLCRDLPIEIRLQDYREIEETFDAVYSIGMFEHVGVYNYRTYFETVRKCLKPDGLSLLHTIGNNDPPCTPDPWIDKYIFPNSMIPAASQVATALESLFVVEDWHNFGPDYDRTLCAWKQNFDAAWPRLAAHYDERFKRMWLFYLCTSAAVFRTRRSQLWQLTLSPNGVPGGYRVPH